VQCTVLRGRVGRLVQTPPNMEMASRGRAGDVVWQLRERESGEGGSSGSSRVLDCRYYCCSDMASVLPDVGMGMEWLFDERQHVTAIV
jgi:hypothetical protein